MTASPSSLRSQRQQVEQSAKHDDVEAGRRLVGHQQGRLVGDRRVLSLVSADAVALGALLAQPRLREPVVLAGARWSCRTSGHNAAPLGITSAASVYRAILRRARRWM